jgi:tetratricopeptide (TPR) repeat protein
MGRKKKQKKKQKTKAQPRVDAPADTRDESPAVPATTKPEREPEVRPAVSTQDETEPTRRPSKAPLVVFLFIVIVVPIYWFFVMRDEGSSTHRLSAAAAPDYLYEDFAGAETCEECHEIQYDAWLNSTHGKAGGNPTTELIIARFDGRPIRFADAIVRPVVAADSSYQFIVEQEGFEPTTLTVSGVIGGGHMVGGGTQGFVSEYPDGTVRFLPFDFIRQEDLWFCNTNTRSDKGWIPITMDMSITECADWPPIRVLGTDDTYANCQECHAALVDLAYDSTAGRYSTRITTLAIDCESCHGPMSEHVERSQPETIGEDSEIAVDALATLTKDGSLNVCFRCHALKDVMRKGYLPGEALADYYSVGLTMLGGGPFFPDGRVRSFAYQGNHRYSDCYLNGSMTCVDCHDPHTQEYRDIWGRELSDRFADEQCTDCHPSKAEDPEAHTFHEPGTDGSRCVDCHMPYLQHPELGYHLRFARSDHTIPIPRPGFDDRMGIVNACAMAGCHADSSIAALERVTRQWYGELKPHKPIVASLIEPETLDQSTAASVLRDSSSFPAALIEALGVFVARFLRPDMAALDADVNETLWQLTRSDDIDVRSTALAALHMARGSDAETNRLLMEELEESERLREPIRARWAVALGTFADLYLQSGELSYAVVTYRKAADIQPDNPAILRNMGLAYANRQNHDSAVAVLRRSIDIDERQALVWVNLGISLENLGDTTGAERAYRTALGVNEHEAMGHFRLANVLAVRRDLNQAAEHYERAIALQPTLAQAHLYLVRVLNEQQEYARMLAAARLWLRYFPSDPRPRQIIMQLDRTLRRR